MTTITTTEALEHFCLRAKTEEFLTIDTEFLRESTYWPQACLIQVGTETEAVAIDVLSPNLNLESLFNLLKEETILKVFHAARQDIEIFYRLMGCLPAPVFDTQIAAMVCGYGDQVGYERLALDILSVKLDKSQRYTNWSLRPLSEKQITYALADVTYLRDIYVNLNEQLHSQKRDTWILEENKKLLRLENYEIDPLEQWKRLKPRFSKPQSLILLQDLTAFREIQAQTHDRPRKHILKDESLLQLALEAPTSEEKLRKMRGLQSTSKDLVHKLIDVIQTALKKPASCAPILLKKKTSKLLPANEALASLLRLYLQDVSRRERIVSRLIASNEDINALAMKSPPPKDLPTLEGWRYALFGETALQIKDGKLAISFNGSGLSLLPLLDDSETPNNCEPTTL